MVSKERTSGKRKDVFKSFLVVSLITILTFVFVPSLTILFVIISLIIGLVSTLFAYFLLKVFLFRVLAWYQSALEHLPVINGHLSVSKKHVSPYLKGWKEIVKNTIIFVLISVCLSIWVINRIENVNINSLPLFFIGILLFLPIILYFSWTLKSLGVTTYQQEPPVIKNVGLAIERKLWFTSLISLILFLAVGNVGKLLFYILVLSLFFFISAYLPVIVYFLFIQENYAAKAYESFKERFTPQFIKIMENDPEN